MVEFLLFLAVSGFIGYQMGSDSLDEQESSEDCPCVVDEETSESLGPLLDIPIEWGK